MRTAITYVLSILKAHCPKISAKRKAELNTIQKSRCRWSGVNGQTLLRYIIADNMMNCGRKQKWPRLIGREHHYTESVFWITHTQESKCQRMYNLLMRRRRSREGMSKNGQKVVYVPFDGNESTLLSECFWRGWLLAWCVGSLAQTNKTLQIKIFFEHDQRKATTPRRQSLISMHELRSGSSTTMKRMEGNWRESPGDFADEVHWRNFQFIDNELLGNFCYSTKDFKKGISQTKLCIFISG